MDFLLGLKPPDLGPCDFDLSTATPIRRDSSHSALYLNSHICD